MHTQELTSPTYSVNSNILKLNSSSIALSTPGCQYQKGPSVSFQQFSQSINLQQNHRPSLPKKQLTIQIDEDYDSDQQEQQTPEIRQSLKPHFNKPSQQNIVSMKGENQKLSQIVAEYEKKMRRLQDRVQASESVKNEVEKENQHLKQLLKKKQQLLIEEKQANNGLIHKLAQFEEKEAQEKFYDEKMRERQHKLRELQKVHQKVVAMNKNLQRQLRQSDKKIMELQKQIQKNAYTNQQEQMSKIRQNSNKLKQSSIKLNCLPNKQNTLGNTVKSVQKKKIGSSQIKKTGRVSSSTTNIVKKLQVRN